MGDFSYDVEYRGHNTLHNSNGSLRCQLFHLHKCPYLRSRLKGPATKTPFFFCIFTYKKCEAEKRDNITASNRGFTRLHNSVSLNVHPAQHTISLIAIHWLLLRYMINTRLYSISPQTLSAFPDCAIILETLCLFAGFDMIFNLWLTTSH